LPWQREALADPVARGAQKLRNKKINQIGNVCYHSMQNILSSSILSKILKIKIYGVIIFPVLYGCETWSLTLREERRLRVFGNRVLRGIFGSERDEVTVKWRKLHSEELNDLYSPNIVRVIKSRRMGWDGLGT
jgi:hypothetical protein